MPNIKIATMSKLNSAFTSVALGMNSGIVFALLVSTTTAYFTDAGISLTMIGILTLRHLPYSFKYLWSPIVDSMHLPYFKKNFGQRKSWILTTQVSLFIAIFSVGFIDISHNFYLLCALLLLISILGSTHDIAMEAYRIELFHLKEPKSGLACSKLDQGAGNSLVVLGFRMGFIISNVLGLYLSTIIPWKWTFCIISLFILPCIIIVWRAKDHNSASNTYSIKNLRTWWKEHFIESLKSLKQIRGIALTLFIIAFYKVSDTYVDTMSIPFFIKIGFTKEYIAGIAKTIGITASMLGTVLGAFIVKKLPIFTSLLLAEIVAAITNLLFIPFLYLGADTSALILVNFMESISFGVCNLVLISYMSDICKNRRFTATHYSLMLSIAMFSRSIISTSSGYIAQHLGWQNFFIISSLLSLPAILGIYCIKKKKVNRANT